MESEEALFSQGTRGGQHSPEARATLQKPEGASAAEALAWLQQAG